MKNSLMELLLKEGVEYRGIIIREAEGHSAHLNIGRVPPEEFAKHLVQVLNAKNDNLGQRERATLVEGFNCNKQKLIARIKELNRQTGLPGICKTGYKQGVVK